MTLYVKKYYDLAYEINEKSVEKITKSLSKHQIIILPTTNSGYGTTDKNIICDETMDLNLYRIMEKQKLMLKNMLWKMKTRSHLG